MAQESRTAQIRPRRLATSGPQMYELVVDPGRRCDNDGGRDASLKFGEAPAETLRATKALMPDYLQGLELVNRAAQAMQAMEDHSHQIQAKAFDLMQQARSNRLEAAQQISALQEELTASEAQLEELAKQLVNAEQRAKTAEEWVERLLEAINAGFAARRACHPENVRAAA